MGGRGKNNVMSTLLTPHVVRICVYQKQGPFAPNLHPAKRRSRICLPGSKVGISPPLPS